MADLLRGACCNLTPARAREAAEAAAAHGVKSVGRLQRRWEEAAAGRSSEDGTAAGVQLLVDQLGLEVDDAQDVACGLAQMQAVADFLRTLCCDLSSDRAWAAAEVAAAHGILSAESLELLWREPIELLVAQLGLSKRDAWQIRWGLAWRAAKRAGERPMLVIALVVLLRLLLLVLQPSSQA